MVTHCFKSINHYNAGLYTVIYTDKIAFLEIDDQTITLGLGIDVGFDKECWLHLGHDPRTDKIFLRSCLVCL